jgi:glucokinase
VTAVGSGAILAGDIGGTKTALAWVNDGAITASRTYASQHYASLADIVREFLVAAPINRLRSACFGVAGPVVNGVAKTTNLPWTIAADGFGDVLAEVPIRLINDLEAVAHGVGVAGDDAFVTLNPGVAGAQGNRAIIAAGTGLGEAGLYWDGRAHQPFASEGGHSSFAPRDARDASLLQFLLAEHHHVSWERVLSGPGLFNVYRFVRHEGQHEEPAWLADRLAAEPAPAVITECALNRRSPLCQAALDLFVSLYGAEAGNLAVKMMATGGLYIGGGIAPKILPALTDGAFLRAFVHKGRMRPLLEATPVRLIVSPTIALSGAAHAATLERR